MSKGKLLNKPKFYIYKITFDNGATYIGSHIQYKENDGYICSSRYYKRHPELKIINREILFYLPTLEQMNIMESIAIIDDKCYSPLNVNGNYGNYITNIHTKLDCPWNKGLKMDKEFGDKISEASRESVICIETGEILDKISDLPHGTEILNGIRKSYRGRHYRRYNSNETTEEKELLNKNALINIYKEEKFYYCKEYNIAWESLSMLCGMLGVNPAVLKKNFNNCYRGMTIILADVNFLLENNSKIIWKLQPPNWNSKKIMCIETGEVFESLKEAVSKYSNIHIGDAANGYRKTAVGYHWKYLDQKNNL